MTRPRGRPRGRPAGQWYWAWPPTRGAVYNALGDQWVSFNQLHRHIIKTATVDYTRVSYRNQLLRLVDMGIVQQIWRETGGKIDMRCYYRLTPLGEPLGTKPD